MNDMKLINKYENEILELIENQMSTDGRDLTQSDLQGRVTVIVMNLIREVRTAGQECSLCKKATNLVRGGNVCQECSDSIPL